MVLYLDWEKEVGEESEVMAVRFSHEFQEEIELYDLTELDRPMISSLLMIEFLILSTVPSDSKSSSNSSSIGIEARGQVPMTMGKSSKQVALSVKETESLTL